MALAEGSIENVLMFGFGHSLFMMSKALGSGSTWDQYCKTFFAAIDIPNSL